MSGKLSLESGDRVDLDTLAAIPMPHPTPTYQPIRHDRLATMVKDIAGDILHDFNYYKSQYGIAREGQQLFGIHTFKNHSDEMGLSVGFRSSYDKSIAIGLAIGAQIFICDNMAFVGEVTSFRKHTSNLLNDLKEMIVMSVYQHRENYFRVQNDSERMKRVQFNDDNAYRMIGLLYGRGILTPRQLPVVKDQWLNPVYDAFKPRNAWSFYNAVTEGLKTSPPHQIMERHIQLHNLLAG